MGEFLFCRFNARGRKQFKNLDKNGLKTKYPDYANLGLPAHKAALDGNLDVLKEVFTAYNEDGIPSRDRNGATPLHLAVRNNNLEAVKWLIRFTDLSPVDVAKHGETPAHVAAAQGHTECLKILVNAEGKADIKGKISAAIDNSGYTALHLATVKQSNDCAKMLIAELGSKGVGPLGESGVTAAHVAASSGNVEVLKMIHQKHKKTLSHQAEDGTTPLYFAAQEGRLEALKYLAEKCKCDLSTASEDGLKPIHAAAQCGHTHIVRYIVSLKGNQAVFEQTPDKATPLHFAACSGNLESARWLINSDLSGALITSKDKNGDTPAHDAADNGQTALLKLLLESGADLYAINNEGNTPYSLALSGDNPDMANFVMSYASKSPQKVDQEPAKMTIYDLNGGVDDVVDFQVGSSSEQQQQQGEPEQPEGDKTGPLSSEAMKGDKASAFLKSTTQTLQSFDEASPTKPAGTTNDNDDLEWTEEELDIFKQEQQQPVASSGTSEDIVVRYEPAAEVEYSPKKQIEQPIPITSEYATVNEIAIQAEKREKKRGRSISKSIKNALRRKKKVSDSKRQPDSPKKGFGGSEMGFKPQFHSNPLQKLGGPLSLQTPTPPPTPATAASYEAQHRNNDDEDEDGAPYDMYSTPDPEVIKKKIERRKQEEEKSENTKLLEDTLEELSGTEENPPLIPEQKFTEDAKDIDEEEAEQTGSTKSVTKLWPPPANDLPDRPNGPKSGSSNVLKKWPPANGGNSFAAQHLQQKRPPIATGGKKWMPPSVQQSTTPEKKPFMKPEPEREPLPVLKPTTPKPPEPVFVSKKLPSPKEEKPKQMFAVLKPVKRDNGPKEEKETELSKIKLKKRDDKKGAIFSHPETEQTSGASDELKQLLKKVAN